MYTRHEQPYTTKQRAHDLMERIIQFMDKGNSKGWGDFFKKNYDVAGVEDLIYKSLFAVQHQVVYEAADFTKRWHASKGGYTEMALQLEEELLEPDESGHKRVYCVDCGRGPGVALTAEGICKYCTLTFTPTDN